MEKHKTSIAKSPRDLGFLESIDPSDSWQLESRFFPSKLGGKPAWLNLKNLPSSSQILCPSCSIPRSFLCQLYANIDDKPDCFHRTLFIFMCRSNKCHKENPRNEKNVFLVLRSQLSRSNPFYSYNPPPETLNEKKMWEKDADVTKFTNICRLCGCSSENSGGGKCSACGKVQYCHPYHQKIDWKARHKKECKKQSNTSSYVDHKELEKILFRQWEIVMESDDDESSIDSSDEENSDEENEKDIETMQALNKKTKHLDTEELSKYMGNEMMLDKYYSRFKDTIKMSPEQVIRYQRSASPLWISSKDIPEVTDIPDCELCGCKRIFEFQIMPQLLNSLNLDNQSQQNEELSDSIDWGVLAIYTCSNSCNDGPSYKPEFIWRQVIQDDATSKS